MLIAQWVMNALQFLGLVALFWYTWETRKMGVRTAEEYAREWKLQYHFSLCGLDPTSGTGRLKGSSEYPVEVVATVINLGRPAFVARGVLIHPEGSVGTWTNIDPLPVASGQMQKFTIDPTPLLNSLSLRPKVDAGDPVTWKGKVTIAFWFEANGKTWKTPDQFLLVDIVRNKIVSLQQITPTEFHYLARAPLDAPE
jgi:hypothetical protein